MNLLISIAASIAYILALGLQWQNLYRPNESLKAFVIAIAFMAIILHGYLLHLDIDIYGGQNVDYYNILSTMLWLVALLTMLTLVRLPVLNLIFFIFPLCILSLILIHCFPDAQIIRTIDHPQELVHIFLSLLAVSFMCIAALQACLLAIQEKGLRNKNPKIMSLLPPLQTMESFLFQTIWLGFFLLTTVIITALIFFHNIFTVDLLPKTLLSIFAWIIYAILLLGRYFAGWRGKIAIRGSLLGFLLLLLAYFCTQLFT